MIKQQTIIAASINIFNSVNATKSSDVHVQFITAYKYLSKSGPIDIIGESSQELKNKGNVLVDSKSDFVLTEVHMGFYEGSCL